MTRGCLGSFRAPPSSRRRAVVVVEPAEQGERRDDRAGEPGSDAFARNRNPLGNPLVGPSGVEVDQCVLDEDVAQVRFGQEALASDAAEKPLADGVHQRRLHRRAHDAHPGALCHTVERAAASRRDALRQGPRFLLRDHDYKFGPAMTRCFCNAIGGTSKERPDLVDVAIPLGHARVSPVPWAERTLGSAPHNDRIVPRHVRMRGASNGEQTSVVSQRIEIATENRVEQRGIEPSESAEFTAIHVDSRTNDPARVDVSTREPVDVGPSEIQSARGALTVEDALAVALVRASAAQEWAVVAQLARELEARRLSAAGVRSLVDERGRSPGRE
jgi:hypothetical protein